MNNQYLRIYVNDLLQTGGWVLALLAVALALGVVMFAVSRSKNIRKAEPENLEAVSREVMILAPTSTEVRTKPLTDLHPMVAQLKAELAGTHIPIETMPVPKMEEETEPVEGQPPTVAGPTTPPIPETVVVGMAPVQKKEEKETLGEEKARTGEKSDSTS